VKKTPFEDIACLWLWTPIVIERYMRRKEHSQRVKKRRRAGRTVYDHPLCLSCFSLQPLHTLDWLKKTRGNERVHKGVLFLVAKVGNLIVS
jgi:hypothetical protein